MPLEVLDVDFDTHPNLGLQYLSYVCVYCCGN